MADAKNLGRFPESINLKFGSTYMDLVGDGTGATNLAVASGTAKLIVNEFVHLERLIFSISDGGTFNSNEFGNITALTTGLSITCHHANGTQFLDLMEGFPIKTNADWGHLAYDVNRLSWGAGGDELLVRLSLNKVGDVVLHNQDYIQMVISDDLSLLTDFHINVQYGIEQH